MTYTLKVNHDKTIKIDKEDIENILSSFCGCGSEWAMIDNSTKEYESTKAKLKKTSDCVCLEDVLMDMLDHGMDIVICEDEEEDGSYDVQHKINLAKILNAVAQAYNDGYVSTENNVVDDDFDSETADVIIQYACFNDIVYG